MGNRRLLYLDYAKGIAILLMLLQHSTPQHNLFRQFTQAFVLPIFFVVGGIIHSYKEYSGEELRFSSTYLIKRWKQLGIPYLVAGIVLIAFYELLSLISGGHSFGTNLIKLITLQGVDSLWFLPVFFLSESLFLLSLLLKDRKYIICLDIAILVVLILFVPYSGSKWPLALLDKSLMGYLFYSAGYLLSGIVNGKNKFSIIALMSILGLVSAYFNGFSSFAEFHYPLLFFYSGISLSLLILDICVRYDRSGFQPISFLSVFGRATLFILCTNNVVIESVRLLDHKMLGDFFLYNGSMGNILFFMTITLIEVLLFKLFKLFKSLRLSIK